MSGTGDNNNNNPDGFWYNHQVPEYDFSTTAYVPNQGSALASWSASGSGAGSASVSSPEKERHTRVAVACIECRRRKIKCSGQSSESNDPCVKCAESKLTCQFVPPTKGSSEKQT